jgi:hypothetical protein
MKSLTKTSMPAGTLRSMAAELPAGGARFQARATEPPRNWRIAELADTVKVFIYRSMDAVSGRYHG